MNKKINRKELRKIINESIIDDMSDKVKNIVDKAEGFLTGADADILKYNRELRAGAAASPDLLIYVQKKGSGGETQRGELIQKKFGGEEDYSVLKYNDIFQDFFRDNDASVMFDTPLQIEYGEFEDQFIVGAYSQIIGERKHKSQNYKVNKLRCGLYVADAPDPTNFNDVYTVSSNEDLSYLFNTNDKLVEFLENNKVIKSDPIAGRKKTKIVRRDAPISSEDVAEIGVAELIPEPSEFHDAFKDKFAQDTADKLYSKKKRGSYLVGFKDIVNILDSYNYDFEFNLPGDQSVIPDSVLDILNKSGVTDHGTPGNGHYVIGIETNTYTDAEGNPKRVAHLKMSQYPDGKDEEGDTDYYRLGRSKKHDRIAYSIISGMPQIEDLLTKGLNESKKNKNKKLLFELVYGRNIF
jgi:hypothetical protein